MFLSSQSKVYVTSSKNIAKNVTYKLVSSSPTPKDMLARNLNSADKICFLTLTYNYIKKFVCLLKTVGNSSTKLIYLDCCFLGYFPWFSQFRSFWTEASRAHFQMKPTSVQFAGQFQKRQDSCLEHNYVSKKRHLSGDF